MCRLQLLSDLEKKHHIYIPTNTFCRTKLVLAFWYCNPTHASQVAIQQRAAGCCAVVVKTGGTYYAVRGPQCDQIWCAFLLFVQVQCSLPIVNISLSHGRKVLGAEPMLRWNSGRACGGSLRVSRFV